MSVLSDFFSIDAVPGARGRPTALSGIYLPELTGLRGVAIMIVVMGHLLERIDHFYRDAWLSDFGKNLFKVFATPFTGCCIFFCISGYSLMLFLYKKARFLDRSAIFLYIQKRILRLYPPYLIVLLLTFFFLVITHYQPVGTHQFFAAPNSLTVSLLTSLGLVHDLTFGTFPRLFPAGWFIETQFQFYVIGPGLLLLYLRLSTARIRCVAGMFFLVISSTISLLIVHDAIRNLAYSIVVFMPYFWVGALLADFRLSFKDDRPGHAIRKLRPIGWCGLAALILVGGSFYDPLFQLSVRILCLAVIFSAAFAEGTGFRRMLLDRWVTRAGVACYSIYLVHLQVLQIVVPLIDTSSVTSTSLAVVICGLCGLSIVAGSSAIFYWLVERPCVAATRLLSASRRPTPTAC